MIYYVDDDDDDTNKNNNNINININNWSFFVSSPWMFFFS